MPNPCYPLYLDCNKFNNLNNLKYEIDINDNLINVNNLIKISLKN